MARRRRPVRPAPTHVCQRLLATGFRSPTPPDELAAPTAATGELPAITFNDRFAVAMSVVAAAAIQNGVARARVRASAPPRSEPSPPPKDITTGRGIPPGAKRKVGVGVHAIAAERAIDRLRRPGENAP
ncbi:hypothetical protein GCM10022225_71660 [Plantactinospora mayteni]|uniref:Uncharacterized protein n=1 Tax=Plantactinospora mayteni TaxID=566021 RepID=A0ABQ4F147_9ACTN|nr:hypothetical protein Pma05_71910 [Plantactinospora mayteni]